jgi:dihydrofolate reductase
MEFIHGLNRKPIQQVEDPMANYVYIAASLDGFIATTEGGIEWLSGIPNPEQSDYGYAEFIKGIDALIVGRKTFEKVLTFDRWPYEKPVFILSNNLTDLPEDISGMAEIVQGDIERIVNQLNHQGYRNLYVDGGETIQSFLAADAIDELIITQIPILLGDGIPLFGKLGQSVKFRLKKTEIFNNTLVQAHYVRDR